MDNINAFMLALGGGILPAVVWLLFWLREDRRHPEPKGMISLAFLAGMLVVPLVLPIELAIYKFFANSSVILFSLWALTEEVLKFGACYFVALSKKVTDEPIDEVIYLITTALGFSALENAFFLINPLFENDIATGVVAGSMRFIGATLLHTVASATIGIFLAFSFYKNSRTRRIAVSWGIFFAVVLHAAFNLFIIESEGIHIFTVFSFVWAAIILLMWLFQRIKRIRAYKT
ncbi:MAG: PrsW family glutamic-type intramembrane protease [bacterium]|nr:PrsW family glutamic-type intramembrane protease [bacterium]